MYSISSRLHCKFNEAQVSSASWHRFQTKRLMQPMLYHGPSSIPSGGVLHLKLRDFKVLVVGNEESSQLGGAAESNERTGENLNASGSDVASGGSKQDSGVQPPKAPSRNEELMQSLRRYGAAGVLSYGLLNTVYYLVAFLFVWFYVAPAPGGMGYPAAAQRFLKILAVVWAGSQVTKLLRVGGALAVAPFVDQGLSWFAKKFKFESRGKAFGTIVVICVGLALSLFMSVTLLWA